MGGADFGISFRYADGEIRTLNVDVIHVHPRRRLTLLGTQETTSPHRLLAVIGFLLRVRSKGIPIVRTVQGPPEGRPRLAQRLLNRATALFIVLDSSTSTPASDRTVVIPHMHYRERYIGYPRSAMIKGRIACFTRTATPAAALSLAESAPIAAMHDVEIRIVGPADPAPSADLRAVADQTDAGLSLREDPLSDGATVQEICAAEMVIVPRFESMDELQIAFMALSLDRPVLLPACEASEHLQDEVGRAWVRISHTPTDVDEVLAALKAIRAYTPGSSPNMDHRDPHAVSAAYAKAFRDVINTSRRASP